MLLDQSQVGQVLSLSDERDLWQKHSDQAFRLGYFLALHEGFAQGYAQCEADEARAWHEIIHPLAHPEAYADARVRNAEALSRREADEHERSFIARAYATPWTYRTQVQQAAVMAYPPPARGP